MFGGGGSRGGDHHAAGYLSRQQNADKIVSAVTDPDDDDDEDDDPALDSSRGDGVSGLFGGAWENPEGVERIEGAFSALTPSMWPENTEHKEGLITGTDFGILGLHTSFSHGRSFQKGYSLKFLRYTCTGIG